LILDLHAVLDPEHEFLDLAQFTPVHVLEQKSLADPQSLTVHLEHALTTIVLDDVVIADREHALAHLVVRGVAAFAPLLPSAKHLRNPVFV